MVLRTSRSRARSTAPDLDVVDRWWRAANYLAVGQIYLRDNALLRAPLEPHHLKRRLLGHWGTTPGLNLLWAHLNRVICQRDADLLFICGPGHGGPAMTANAWLEGSYTERFPSITQDERGMTRLFEQFSFPGGVPSHAAPETPGSIHEGGELGYSLAHAYGAAFDNPSLVVACVIGDGEAETGALAASWHSTTFIDPVRDGAVLPILHLNGWKIANPTVLARMPEDDLRDLFHGWGHEPIFVSGDEPRDVHEQLAAALDTAFDAIEQRAEDRGRRRSPAIVLRTPKGWTGPAVVDGIQVEGTWRAHQVPLDQVVEDPGHRAQLEAWMRRYDPDDLFPEGRPSGLDAILPAGDRRMSATPVAHGGRDARPLELPSTRPHAAAVPEPGAHTSEPTRVLGRWLRDVMAANEATASFRIFGPDETASNRLDAVYEVTAKAFQGPIGPLDEHLSPTGRVLEILSEHVCEGWLEGYTLTGRHGLFSTYEAFAPIVDSMLNQHLKWLRGSQEIKWRRPVPALNQLLSSHVWRQDHNGFSHQDPGFIDHVLSKPGDVARVYLPPDANTLLHVMDRCLRATDVVNVVIAGKQSAPDWLSWEEAELHCARGVGRWAFASNDVGCLPDVVLVSAGDVPTTEALAAVGLLRTHLPDLKVRFVNVVDLLRLSPPSETSVGLSDAEYDALFTTDRPVIFAFHGYPWLIHRLTYRRVGHGNLHVRGYKEIGTTTTPFDMVLMNDLDRYRLVMDVIDRVPGLGVGAAGLRQEMVDRRHAARAWTRAEGVDHPDVTDWQWGQG